MRVSQSTNAPRQSAVPASAVASSLWLRVGFFGGASLLAIGLRAFATGEAAPLQALTALLVGAALAAFSLHRSWTLLQDAEASPRAGLPAAAVRRSLQHS